MPTEIKDILISGFVFLSMIAIPMLVLAISIVSVKALVSLMGRDKTQLS